MKLNSHELEAIVKARHGVKLTTADKKALSEIIKKCTGKNTDWKKLAPYLIAYLGVGDKFDKFKDLFSG
jgi:hypothetical protein